MAIEYCSFSPLSFSYVVEEGKKALVCLFLCVNEKGKERKVCAALLLPAAQMTLFHL